MSKSFAKLENNCVAEIITFFDEKTIDENLLFLKNYSKNHENWIEVDPHVVQSGFFWSEDFDKFIPPKPFESWVFDDVGNFWKSPIEYPDDGLDYFWDENSQQWVEVLDGT